MVEGRSKQVFKSWLADREKPWRDRVEVVAMDGFSGFKTAAAEELPGAAEVMDPFHGVKLTAEAVTKTRQRVQIETTGHRGRKKDPLYVSRRTLLTGKELLSQRQEHRLKELFQVPEYQPVYAAWVAFQQVLGAYRKADRPEGKRQLAAVAARLSCIAKDGHAELRKLGGTLKLRNEDILAYFDFPGTSNGPTEALNGRLEHLRGIALGFRNLAHYVARSLLEAGGFRPWLHSQS